MEAAVTSTAISVAGRRATRMVLHVPGIGPWWLDVSMDDADALSGAVDIVCGGLSLSGTVAESFAGSFGQQAHARIVAGGDGWRKLVAARAYHDDGAGVDARTVAAEAAVDCGEVLSDFSPSSPTVGRAYVRTAGPASKTIEAAAGDAPWRVDYDGFTRVGARPSHQTGAYELLDFDPVARLATIGADDADAIRVGDVLAASSRLPEAQTVRELRIEVEPEALTIYAWCEPTGADVRSRGLRAIEAIVERVLARRLLVPLQYRVVRMAAGGERVELQAVSEGAPDIAPVSLSPGMAGLHASLTGGEIVYVSFVEGNPSLPRIVGHEGVDGPAWAPSELDLDATGASASIKAGRNATEALAWSSKLLAELMKIEATLLTGSTPPGGGAVTFATPYTAPTSAATLGTAKTVAE